jgi:hypothetical protein
VASADLVVDVSQFAACIFQEKLALNRVDRGEEVSEEDSEPQEKLGPVLMKNEPLVRHKKLQLAHKTKQSGEQNRKGDKHGIPDHDLTSWFMQQFVPPFRPV